MEGHVMAGETGRLFEREEATPAVTSAAARVRLATREPFEIVDLTPQVEAFVQAAGVVTGWVNVQSRHTTTGLLVNELEPRFLRDLRAGRPASVYSSRDDISTSSTTSSSAIPASPPPSSTGCGGWGGSGRRRRPSTRSCGPGFSRKRRPAGYGACSWASRASPRRDYGRRANARTWAATTRRSCAGCTNSG